MRDFSRLIIKVLNSDKEKINRKVFNAGSDQNNFTKEDILKLILKRIPNSKIIVKKGGVDRRDYRVSFEKVEKELNFKAKYSVQDALDLIEAGTLPLRFETGQAVYRAAVKRIAKTTVPGVLTHDLSAIPMTVSFVDHYVYNIDSVIHYFLSLFVVYYFYINALRFFYLNISIRLHFKFFLTRL